MAVTVQNVRIQLRRTNESNYAEHPDFLPLKGEICLSDVINDKNQTELKVKVGDGETLYKDLPWYYPIAGMGNSSVELGYYHDGQFYYDPNYTQSIDPNSDNLYIDKSDNKIYYYADGAYHTAIVDFAEATSERAGIAKLYDQTGDNIDGAMTQRATTTELQKRVAKLQVQENSECLVVSYVTSS